VILDLGADLFERTGEVHPDNLELFRAVARLFNTRLVGIDFLAEDISKSWRGQNAAIIELNSLPYIDMHHFPTKGEPVNVGGFICDMVEKYYK
jgi:cyanophycin synthetase